ncbi:MAG: choice-of-anchor D domain-containing protein [Candidatus Acidiferrum sp.]
MPDIPKGYHALAGSERHPSKGTELLGPADPKEKFTITISLRRRPDGPPLPDFDYFEKTPPDERQRLPEQSFAAKYGALPADVKLVEEFAHSHGLTVVESDLARRTVQVSGTVEQMSKAFGVKLGRYRHSIVRRRGGKPETETYRGRDGFIHIPNDLKDIVVGVFGLDNRTITKHNSADPPNTVPLSTTEITKLYDFPKNFAAGQTIGIVSVAGYLASDISSTFGGSPPQVTDVSVDGATNGGFPDGETTQDICIAGLAAPGAAIAVYFQPGTEMGWVDLFHKVAHPHHSDPHCSVVSSSFYICDGDDPNTLTNESVSTGLLDAVSEAFRDAAIQGVTICIASGDTGANSKVGGNPAAWGFPFPPDHKAHVQFPGSSPWVLAVGGTTIGNVSGLTFDEYVWNDPVAADPSQWGTTGGGVSAFFPKPSYQSAAHIPVSLYNGTVGRGVPDVAGNASLNSGYSGIFEGGVPSLGNGTSASSPLWAGLIAVINGALGVNVGFVNPAIYALGSSVFRDIVPGAGPANNSNSGVTGYPAHAGWDACSGWGSPRGVALLHGLRHFYGPAIALNLQDNLHFGVVCRDAQRYRTLEIFNVGTTDLMVHSVRRHSGSSDFTVLPAPATPLAVAPGSQINFTIEFNPTSHGVTETATIRITSDDPVTPFLDVTATGSGGTGTLVVTGSTCFGGVKACCRAERTISICNVGDCKLHVSSVAFKRKNPHWKLINNPFPATLHPGSCLGVVIRYKATERCPRSCELIISSDDPATPVKTLEVLAYTEWNGCSCKNCCEDCRKGTCQKHDSGDPCGETCSGDCDEEEEEGVKDHA